MNIKTSMIFFGHSGCVHSEGRSLNTTIRGPIERHKSRLASRETGDGLTGTRSGGSLERTELVPKWSRKRRGCVGLRESSQRDNDMRSMPPFPPEQDSFRFYIIVWPFVLSGIYSSSIVPGIGLVTLAP